MVGEERTDRQTDGQADGGVSSSASMADRISFSFGPV